MAPRRRLPACLALILCGVPACEQERVVYYRPMLAGLPGTESNTPITDPRPRGAIDVPPPTPNEELVVKSPDRKQTHLVARTAHHLMIHVYTTLRDGDEALFLDQVLSVRTRDEYFERGLDSREAFTFLTEHLGEVKKLFDQMPMGEYTPGLYLEPVGPNIFRLEVHGKAAQDLSWTGFDMIREGADYRLRWFTGPGPRPVVAKAAPADVNDPPVVIGRKRE